MSGPYEVVKSIGRQLLQAQMNYWIHHVVFTFNWWFLLVASVSGWTIWALLVERNRVREIVLLGSFVLIITTILDGIGSELQLWTYPVQMTPTFARFIPVDFAGMPIFYMLLYQYFRTWRSFTIASCVLGGCLAFVVEPLVIHMGIYESVHWRHIYSFPIYIAIALFVRWLVETIWSFGPRANV